MPSFPVLKPASYKSAQGAAQPGSGEYLTSRNIHKVFRQVGINNDPLQPANRHALPGSLHRHTGPTRNQLPPGVKPQKCRFWPHCIKDDCNFVHPTRLCAHFPGCRHGEACLFIHPACKFGPQCNRSDCRFSHAHITNVKGRGGPSPPPAFKPVGHLPVIPLHRAAPHKGPKESRDGKDDRKAADDDEPVRRKETKEPREAQKEKRRYSFSDDD